MVLLSDNSGIEVIVYFMGILQLLGIFLATRLGHEYSKYWLALLPVIAVLGVIGGGDVLDGFPSTLLVLLGLGPFIEAGINSLPEGHDWKWFALPGVMVVLRFIHGDVLIRVVIPAVCIWVNFRGGAIQSLGLGKCWCYAIPCSLLGRNV